MPSLAAGICWSGNAQPASPVPLQKGQLDLPDPSQLPQVFGFLRCHCKILAVQCQPQLLTEMIVESMPRQCTEGRCGLDGLGCYAAHSTSSSKS